MACVSLCKHFSVKENQAQAQAQAHRKAFRASSLRNYINTSKLIWGVCLCVFVCVPLLNKSSLSSYSLYLILTPHISYIKSPSLLHLHAILLLKLINLRSYKWYQSPNNDLGVFLSSFLLKSYTFHSFVYFFFKFFLFLQRFSVKVVVFIEVLVILSVLGKIWSIETSGKSVFGWKNRIFSCLGHLTRKFYVLSKFYSCLQYFLASLRVSLSLKPIFYA